MKYYFLSDAHLGSLTVSDPAAHQAKFIGWLEMAAADGDAIFLLGDIFDFWFEFPKAIPEGYDAVIETIRRTVQRGVEVHFFCGNHDQWTFGYLESHCGVKLHRKEFVTQLCGKTFFMHHGHGLGEMSSATRRLNALFESRISRWLFRYLMPPRAAWSFGYKWSERNRLRHSEHDGVFLGENNEPQVIFAKHYSAEHPGTDYIVMGHRHIELNLMLATGTQLVILGDFFNLFTYAVFDGKNISLETYL